MTGKKAIKRLQSWVDSGYYSLNNQDINWEDDKHALDLAIKALEEEERPKGEWLHHEEYTNNRTFYITECPFCKLRVQEETNFCPNCGADMRGDAE